MSTGRCKNKLPTHKIINVDFTNTNPWYKNKKDITVTVDLLLPELKKASMKAELLYSEYVDQSEEVIPTGENLSASELTRIELLQETDYLADTKRKFIIPFKVLQTGTNTVIITVKDEDDPHEESVYIEEVTLENRDSFSIKRKIKNKSEYVTTGTIIIDNGDGAHSNMAGMESGVLIPQNSINMDGRCSIESVNMDADNDEFKETTLSQEYSYFQDHYDYVVYKYPIGKFTDYESINKIILKEKEE